MSVISQFEKMEWHLCLPSEVPSTIREKQNLGTFWLVTQQAWLFLEVNDFIQLSWFLSYFYYLGNLASTIMSSVIFRSKSVSPSK